MGQAPKMMDPTLGVNPDGVADWDYFFQTGALSYGLGWSGNLKMYKVYIWL